ncbi:MAG: UvrD-helicase domain-containing protein [Paludibacteraceae bacterium]
MFENIKIYKASAGSGKTYRLAYEYVLLLFRNRACVHPHRSTLAATFTNKATDEMKRRIIRELFALTYDTHAPFLAELTQDLAPDNLSLNDIQQLAQRFLSDILHDYSAFNVSTIDRFFQQIVRAFTREIGLQGDFGVELDHKNVLKMAIDNMLFELDKSANQQLLEWLKQYISENLTPQADSKKPVASWTRFRTNIETLGGEIFKESYLQFATILDKKLADKTFFANYQKQLQQAKQQFELKAKKICDTACYIRQKHNLEWNDFSGKDRSFTTYFDFAKLKSKNFILTATFLKAIDNIDKWTTATSPRKACIEAAFRDGLNDCAKQLTELNVEEYLSVCAMYEQIYILGILNDVRRQISDYCNDKNVMLIGSTTDFLNQIIQGCDTPFVYEKTGTYLHHFMLDEFQDTSQLQWHNFKPLLRNSVSENNRNLIVGDVKQSIYRWRSSDWRLLQSGIQTEFGDYVGEQVLNTNWRSAKNIVAFNNAFFSQISACVQTMVSEKYASLVHDIYDEVAQLPHRTTAGRVSVELLANDDTATWKQRVLQRLPSIVDELLQHKYTLSQITVLVRQNNEAVQVADALLAAGYKVVSSEALQVANATCIRLLVAVMRFFVAPDNTLNRKLIETLLQTQTTSGTTVCQPRNETAEIWMQRVFPNNHDEIALLRNQPLFQLVEGLILALNLHGLATNDVFLQAFQDIVFNYTARFTNDLNGFLEYWDEKGTECFLPASDTQEAIRIMTIHKSKGLEFKAVIIPFCQWDCKVQSIIWCKTPSDHQLLGQLPIVPLKAKTLLTNTYFKNAYETERLYTLVDTINVAYVAFTRAENDLYILGPKAKNTQNASASLNIVNLLEQYLRSCNDIQTLNEDDTHFFAQMGNLQSIDTHDDAQTHASLTLTYNSVSAVKRLKLRYMPDDTGCERRYGLLMHDILSQLHTADELPKILQYQLLHGHLTADRQPQIQRTIEQLLANDHARQWFSGKYRVLNETEIISPQGQLYRPDRVMMNGKEVIVVDYKFGAQHESRYHRQVQCYADLITSMGYNVTGFIWYAQTNEIEQVC